MVSGRRFHYQGCCKPVVIYVVSSIENQNRIIHRGLHLTNSCRNTLIFILLLLFWQKQKKIFGKILSIFQKLNCMHAIFIFLITHACHILRSRLDISLHQIKKSKHCTPLSITHYCQLINVSLYDIYY